MALVALGLALFACRSAERPQPPGRLLAWAAGPVHWLLQPEEASALRQVRSESEASEFIAAFWRRRDPTPEEAANPVLAEFSRRAAAADRLYSEGVTPGSLTDRGGALILLGAPSLLRYAQRAVPTWDAARPRERPGKATKKVAIEVWGYRPTDLPPRLLALLPEEEATRPEITLTFVREPQSTYLIEGRKLLALAAQALVREESLASGLIRVGYRSSPGAAPRAPEARAGRRAVAGGRGRSRRTRDRP